MRYLAEAFSGESRANRKYLAFAIKAMEEGSPEIANCLWKRQGQRPHTCLNHLKAMGVVKSTKENVGEAAEGENYEIEEMYPKFVKEAKSEGREDAAKSFELALEREKHHREMFREALKKLT
jgi:rubrerythrin